MTVSTVEPPAKVRKTKQHSTTKTALQLVKQTNLSSSKSARVCKQLSDHGIDIPTPTQPAIYKASVRESQKMQQNFEEALKNENWTLHFAL